MMIRKAEEKDVKNILGLLFEVQAIHAEGRPDIFKSGARKYSETDILDIIKNPLTPVYVAVNDSDLAVGYAFCAIIEQKESSNLHAVKNFYIDDLCICKSLRGKGIGKELYNYILEKAKSLGCYHLTLNVWHLNASALKFYTKLGMNPLKTTMEQILIK